MENSTDQIQHRRLPYKWTVVFVVIFGSFMSILDQTVVNNALPHLQQVFGVSLSRLQWVITAYTLTQGVITPITAFFSNRIGTKRFYVISLCFFTLGSILCGLSWNLSALILFRIIQAIGGATLFPLGVSLIFYEFLPHERGLASGFLSVSALLAPAIGPTLGGFLITYSHWSLIFYINVPIGIIAILLAVFFLRERRSDVRVHFDLPGFILVSSSLTAILYALSNANILGWFSPTILVTLIGGLCLLVLFIVVEINFVKKGKQPLIELGLFKNGTFLFSNIANALISFGFFGGMILLPIYMQSLRGLNAFQSGLLILPQAFASVLSAIVGGKLIDRFSPRIVLFPGLILLSLSSLELANATLTSSYSWLLIVFTLRGLGLGLLLQTLTVCALSKVLPNQYTQASSLNTVIRFVFTALGITVLTTLIQNRTAVHVGILSHKVNAISYGDLALIRRQGMNLAVQDSFYLTLVAFIMAFIATWFIHIKKPQLKKAVNNVES
jgi:EmrB/QacA subfamily drug resistance transporter